MALPVVLAVRPAWLTSTDAARSDAFALRPRVKYDSTNRECFPAQASVSRTLELAVPIANGGPRGPPGEEPGQVCRRDAQKMTKGAVAAAVDARCLPHSSPSTVKYTERHEKGPPRYTEEDA